MSFKFIKFSLLIIILLCFVTVFIYGLNKCIDFTDEGFYNLGSSGFQELNGNFYKTYFLLINKIIPFRISYVSSRIAESLFYFVSTLMLFFSVFTFSNHTLNYVINKYTLINSCIIFIILHFTTYAYTPKSLSYNTLTSNFSMLSLSFMLLFLVYHKYVLAIVSGAFTYFILYSKFSSFFSLIFVNSILIILASKSARSILFFYVGIVLSALVLHIFVYPINQLIVDILTTISAVQNIQYGYSITEHLDKVYELIHVLFLISIPLLFNVILLQLVDKIKSKYSWLIGILFLVINFKLIHTWYSRDITIHLLLSFMSFFIFIIKNNNKKYYKAYLFIFIVMFYPFFIAAGTNTSWLYNARFSLIIFNIPLLFLMLNEEILKQKSLHFILLLYIGFNMYDFYQGFVIKPYRSAPLYVQNYSLNFLPNASSIYTDSSQYEFLKSIQYDLLNSNYKNEKMVGFQRKSGYIFLLGATSPNSVFWSWEYESPQVNPLSLSNSDLLNCYWIVDDSIPGVYKQYLEERYNSPFDSLYTRVNSYPHPSENKAVLLYKPVNFDKQNHSLK